MPWHISQNHPDCSPGQPWAVVKDADGSLAGCSATREEATAHLRALYANERDMALAAEPDPPIAAGLFVVAADTGRVLLLQRALDDTDLASGRWEGPGGHIDEGESPYEAALREFAEEVGIPAPGELVGHWLSDNGVYAGFIHRVETEADVHLNLDADDRPILNPDHDPDHDCIEVCAWWAIPHLAEMPALREECRSIPWHKLQAVAGGGAAWIVAEAMTMLTTLGNPLDLPIADFDAARHYRQIDPDPILEGQAMTVTETTSFTLPPAIDALPEGLVEEDRHWESLMLVEGTPTGDGRVIALGGITGHRDLPLPLMVMFRNPDSGAGGHAGAEISGRTDWIEQRGSEWWGGGIYDFGRPSGVEAARLNKAGMMRGVSVDLDGPPVVEVGADGRVWVSSARIMGLTQCPFAAFAEATINLVRVEHDPTIVCPCRMTMDGLELCSCEDLVEGPDDALPRLCSACGGALVAENADLPALVASGALMHDIQVWTPIVQPLAIVASGGIPTPAAGCFDLPAERPVHPLRVFGEVLGDGFRKMAGYLALWGDCHIGNGAFCIPVPRAGLDGYRRYQTGQVRCDDGSMHLTGPVIMDTYHPDLAMAAGDAQAFYAKTGCGVGDIALYEDTVGIYAIGVARPGITGAQIYEINASDGGSPDWRPINGRHELVAVLAVNCSAFKVPGALVASGADMRAQIDLGTGEVGTIVGRPGVDRMHVLERELAAATERLVALEAAEQARVSMALSARAEAMLADLPDPATERREAALVALDSLVT